MKLHFLGAAGEVTGSCCLVEHGRHRVLLDCGLIQGGRRDEARNADPFPFDVKRLSAVVLSHAHLDHSGRIPLLAQRGYRGPVYTHAATRGLCRILHPDAASLAERDADRESTRRARKGRSGVKPLYGQDDVREGLKLFQNLPFGKWQDIAPGMRARLHEAGHIIGAASVELELEGREGRRRLVYSGDIGSYEQPILRDPAAIPETDALIMESTYGDRDHRSREETLAELKSIITGARHDEGNIIIPSFAVGRSQDLLYLFGKHWHDWGMERWTVYLDSPMAIQASQVYLRHGELHDEETRELAGAERFLPPLPNLRFTRSPEESIRLNGVRSGAIVIAGSGMCNGGRVLHHLKHNVWRPECHVMIVGYQARGTLGRRLVDGEPWVRIHGEAIRVEARVHTVGGLSAHAGQSELLRWYDAIPNRPPVWLVHGEPHARDALAARLDTERGVSVTRPSPGATLDLVTLHTAEAADPG